MSCEEMKTVTPPFPMKRPEITVTPTDEPPFEVDWRELAWWFAVPEVGDHTLWAIYDPPDWQLREYVEMRTTRPARVHELDCVEIDAPQYEVGETVKLNPWTFYARLTEDRVQYLASVSLDNDVRRVYTLLDEGFDKDWGDSQRRVRRTGSLARQPDGSYHMLPDRLQLGDTIEAVDVCLVTVGGRRFTCLHVIDVMYGLSEERMLMEAYLTREGRTVLCHRYNGRLWQYGSVNAKEHPWDERLPDAKRIVIDGVTFVHWYDCLSGLACGISQTPA